MQGTEEYQEVEAALAAVGTQVHAAEAHGLLCGLASAPGKADKAVWIAQVLADTQPRGEEAKHLLATLVALYERTVKSLEATELDFQLLLPADEAPLDQRARALGEWCGGFLAGVGLGGVKQDKALAGDVAEALRDLGSISQVELDAAEGEENEEAYAELVEFVRVAAMLVKSTLQTADKPQPPAGKGKTLH